MTHGVAIFWGLEELVSADSNNKCWFDSIARVVILRCDDDMDMYNIHSMLYIYLTCTNRKNRSSSLKG